MTEIVYTKTFGALEVLEIIDKHKARVRFFNTGYETIAFRSNIRSGEVKDPTMPILCGVGFIGVGKHKSRVNGKPSLCYSKWSGMIRRCYGDHSGKNRCYKDVNVCNEWHNFQNFAAWFYDNYPESGGKFDLDKDLKSSLSKIYSPETCTFLKRDKNVEVSHAKFWDFISPCGKSVKVYNLSKFCEENGLLDSKMNQVSSGKRKTHKGWSAPIKC